MTVCTMLVAVVCACVVLFAKEGILIFATKEYIDAVWFIPPLAMATLFSFIYGILGNIMFYYEKTWQMSLITIICAVVNIVTNYFGIKYFGYLAAGYTTLGCSMLQMLLCYFVARKYEKNLNQIVDLRCFFLIIGSYVVVMVYAMILHNIFWARLGLLAVVLLTVVILHKKIIAMFKTMKSETKKKKEVAAEEVKVEDSVAMEEGEIVSVEELTEFLDEAVEEQ